MKPLLLLIIILSFSVYSQDGEPIKPIVGGTSVNIADYPYQVSLQSKSGMVYFHFCGGSIINKDWILSAAHCVPTTAPEDLYIRIGFTELSSSDGQIFQVEEIILHPNYNNVTYDNDIALIKLKTSINFNSITADSIILATKQDENSGLFPEGTPAFVTGWGHTSFGGPGSNILQMGEVEIVSNNTVMNVWGNYVGALTNNMLAAGLQAGGVDACQGDSGGPLVVVDSDNGNFVQVGVVSWGDGCAEVEKPGVYAKVSNYTNWINFYVYPVAENDSDFSDFPNQGDGNDDGVRDDLQVNVETIKDFANNTFITIEAPSGVTLSDVNSVSPIASEKFTFPFGLFEFKIASSFAVVKLYFHGISDLNKYAYHKLFPDNRLRIFDNAVFSSTIINGKEVAVVTLTLTDGGAGDFDGIVNGIIYDPGGPGIPITANIPIWDWWYALILIPVLIFSYKKYGTV